MPAKNRRGAFTAYARTKIVDEKTLPKTSVAESIKWENPQTLTQILENIISLFEKGFRKTNEFVQMNCQFEQRLQEKGTSLQEIEEAANLVNSKELTYSMGVFITPIRVKLRNSM
jgi:predicted nucleotidyltransferase